MYYVVIIQEFCTDHVILESMSSKHSLVLPNVKNANYLS